MAGNKTNWMELMSNCLAGFLREQAGSACPVVDYEVRMAPAGTTDDIRVWFVCRTQAERNEFASAERSRSISVFKKKMISAGFPDSAVASVEIMVTSREEIERGGGNAYFLR